MESIFCKYIESSGEANMIMSGLGEKIDQRYSTWTKSQVAKLKREIKRMQKPIHEPIILYRGAQCSPVIEDVSDDQALERFIRKDHITNPSPISTSTSRNIAKEFIYRRGYLHVLHLDAGVQVVDFKETQCKTPRVMNGKIREKEIMIAPNHTFIPSRRYNDTFHWRVTRNGRK